MNPPTRFVAGFIGNPPMNLFEGSYRLRDRELEFRAGDLTLNVQTHSQAETGGAESGHATLGLRPEDIALAPPGPGHLAFDGTIDVIENLGGDHIVYLVVRGQRVMVRTSPDSTRRAGDVVTASWSTDALHVFINQKRVPVRRERHLA